MFANLVHAAQRCRHLAKIASLSLLAMGAVDTAEAETRYLKFYNLHTHEKASFAYKRNGRYDAGELKKINWFLRDWRKSKAVTMDHELLDLIWEAYRQSGSKAYINVICGYRSPATNNMLRSRTSGVAQQSQHTLGKALDFFIPDVPLKKLREIGLKMQVGGVGYYPKSGSPFVHFDVGRARHWPRMSRSQLAAVFPKGNTVHVPSDGKPLPGYKQAMASYEQRRSSSGLQVANAASGGKSFFAKLFGGGNDEAEDEADVQMAAVRARPSPSRAASATLPVGADAALPRSRPTDRGGTTTTTAMDIGDDFDTSDPVRSSVASAQDRQVAALDAARIPVPRWASRSTSAPTETIVAQEIRRNDADRQTVAAVLAADLGSTSSRSGPEKAAVQTTLAYAVPTPGERPAFSAALGAAATKAEPGLDRATAKSADASNIARETPAAADIELKQDIRQVVAAAATPSARPQRQEPAASTRSGADTAPLMREASTLPVMAKKDGSIVKLGATSDDATQGTKTSAPGRLRDKGGRVRGMAPLARPAPTSRPDHTTIAPRIELASLVEDPAKRARGVASRPMNGHRLVATLPETVVATGFEAPDQASDGRSNHFFGSAVTFMPVMRLAD